MKRLMTMFATICLALYLLVSCGEKKTSAQTSSASDSSQSKTVGGDESLRKANDGLYSALNSMFTGDLKLMDSVWSHSPDVTDLGPFGGKLVGWDSVNAEFKKEAGMKLGGKVECTDVIAHAGKDMGYCVCTEVGKNMSADGKAVMVSHRATNVFRIENGQWKLVHHHTDLSPQLQAATGDSNK